MARKVQVLLVDDLDGTDLGENGETLAFGVAGERYEIDLSHANAEKFRTQMGQYVQAARNVTRVGNRGGGATRRATGATRGASSDETKAARAWLIEQGILTAESRGRISQDNWEKYHARGQMTTASVATATGEAAKAAKDRSAATTEKPAAGGTAETAQTPDKAPRGNSTTPAKAAAKGTTTPATAGVAS